MKAVINLDVPEWQIGQPVSVYFPDTMQKKGTCELLKEQEAVEPKQQSDGTQFPWTTWWYVCGVCGREIDRHDRFCRHCGREMKWR